MSFKCEDCNDTGVIFGTMGVEHVCHCQIKDMSDAEMADIVIKENNALRTENEALKVRVAELEAKTESLVSCARKIVGASGTWLPDSGDYISDSDFLDECEAESVEELVELMAKEIFKLEQEKNNKQWDGLPAFMENEALKTENQRMREIVKELLINAQEIKSLNPEYCGDAIIKTTVDMLVYMSDIMQGGE